jgi:hypothetical protein
MLKTRVLNILQLRRLLEGNATDVLAAREAAFSKAYDGPGDAGITQAALEEALHLNWNQLRIPIEGQPVDIYACEAELPHHFD